MEAIETADQQWEEGVVGLSRVRIITDALREAGLLREEAEQ
jgi:hypothetical protein